MGLSTQVVASSAGISKGTDYLFPVHDVIHASKNKRREARLRSGLWGTSAITKEQSANYNIMLALRQHSGDDVPIKIEHSSEKQLFILRSIELCIATPRVLLHQVGRFPHELQDGCPKKRGAALKGSIVGLIVSRFPDLPTVDYPSY